MAKILLTEEDIRKDREKRYRKRLTEFIVGRMETMNLKQKDLSKELNISQQNVSYRIKNCTFSGVELLNLFRILQATPEEMDRLRK